MLNDLFALINDDRLSARRLNTELLLDLWEAMTVFGSRATAATRPQSETAFPALQNSGPAAADAGYFRQALFGAKPSRGSLLDAKTAPHGVKQGNRWVSGPILHLNCAPKKRYSAKDTKTCPVG
jgi:hypothetical protein